MEISSVAPNIFVKAIAYEWDIGLTFEITNATTHLYMNDGATGSVADVIIAAIIFPDTSFAVVKDLVFPNKIHRIKLAKARRGSLMSL